jgi:hypothetical protein
MALISLQVGEKYPHKILEPGLKIEIDSEFQINLLLNMSDITNQEMEDIKNKRSYALYYDENIAFICVKFGSMRWCDAPFHAGLYSTNKIKINFPVLENDQSRFTVLFTAVEENSNIIKYLNDSSLSPNFSRKFLEIAKMQYEKPITNPDYMKNIQAIYNKFDSKQLANRACVKCFSGD